MDQPVEREPTPQRDQETNLFYTVQQEIPVLYYELKKTNKVCRVTIEFILINRFNGICIITYVFKRGKVFSDLRKPRLVILGAPATQIQIKNKYFGSWRISLCHLFTSSAVKKKMQMHNHFHTEIKVSLSLRTGFRVGQLCKRFGIDNNWNLIQLLAACCRDIFGVSTAPWRSTEKYRIVSSRAEMKRTKHSSTPGIKGPKKAQNKVSWFSRCQFNFYL